MSELVTQTYCDSSPFQDVAGYSRAVRRGSSIAVSGTTATGPDGAALYPGDTGAQTQHALWLVVAAISALGGSVEDVVRTRLLLAPGSSWTEAAAAHRSFFADIAPANSTYFVAGLIGSGFLVEVEADAVVAS